MAATLKLAIVSDIHFAGAAEQHRTNYEARLVANPLARLLLRAYHHFVWLRDPFAHNHLLDVFVERMQDSDWVVVNGDFSCDSAMVGMSDDAAFASATECLGKLRGAFGGRFRGTIGDHELGKVTLLGSAGGLRLESWHRTVHELALEPVWKLELGRYTLIGLTSTLAAFPVYELEALPGEVEYWQALREQHLAAVRTVFRGVGTQQRILLFCHDPTALPFLLREEAVWERLPQIERTVIGHLHSNLVLRQGQLMAGMPRIGFLGKSVRRMSSALREAKHWQAFNILLCPSLAGTELMKDGGYYEARLRLDMAEPAKFIFHPLAESRSAMK